MDAIDAIADHYSDVEEHVEIDNLMLIVAIKETDGNRTNVLYHCTDLRNYVQEGLISKALEAAKEGESA